MRHATAAMKIAADNAGHRAVERPASQPVPTSSSGPSIHAAAVAARPEGRSEPIAQGNSATR